jgi:glycerol-3-phosphate dehydrogenase
VLDETGQVSTSKLARTHEIEVLPCGLVSVMGGKWTTFRAMGQDTVDCLVKDFGLLPTYKSRTSDFKLIGSSSSYEGVKMELLN